MTDTASAQSPFEAFMGRYDPSTTEVVIGNGEGMRMTIAEAVMAREMMDCPAAPDPFKDVVHMLGGIARAGGELLPEDAALLQQISQAK